MNHDTQTLACIKDLINLIKQEIEQLKQYLIDFSDEACHEICLQKIQDLQQRAKTLQLVINTTNIKSGNKCCESTCAFCEKVIKLYKSKQNTNECKRLILNWINKLKF